MEIDAKLLFDGILGVFSTIGFAVFAFWWGRYRRATIVYIYVTVLLLGISFSIWSDFVLRYSFLEYIRADGGELSAAMKSYRWQMKNFIMTAIVVILVTHMTIRMIRTMLGVKMLRKSISCDDRVGCDYSVLVVEDDEHIPLILKNYFDKKHPGAKMEFCISGEEALNIVKEKSIGIFIIDIHLRGKMNGFDLCAAIREEVPWGIIIGITGYPTEYPLSKARRSGFDDYFIKPFRLSDMDTALQSHIHRMTRWGKIRQRKPPRSII